MIEKFFTTEQVANILQVHPFTILKFIKDGKLKGIKLGRVYRIKETDVKDFLENSSTQNKSPRKENADEAPKVPERAKDEKEDTDQHYYLI